MEPFGKSALTGNHSGDWSLTSTLSILKLKKLSIRRNREFGTSTHLSLNISPLYHALSKALNISRNTPRISRVGKHQKLYIIFT